MRRRVLRFRQRPCDLDGGADPPPALPPPPSAVEERRASALFRALSPRLGRAEQPAPPGRLAPYSQLWIDRRQRSGRLAATFYPAAGEARGAVLLVHPWMVWGQSYFHRRGRLEALRASGYHALTFDLGGVGQSDPPVGFYHHDVADALAWLRRRVGSELPLHLWGVSAGGYWAHPVLSRTEGVSGAAFEDVSPHLFEWSQRMAPWGWPCYLLFRGLFATTYRFLDLRRHAPHLRLTAAAYASGAEDRGIRPAETRALARLAGADVQVIEAAGHLGAIKEANRKVIATALSTFARAERRRRGSISRAGDGRPRVPAYALALTRTA